MFDQSRYLAIIVDAVPHGRAEKVLVAIICYRVNQMFVTNLCEKRVSLAKCWIGVVRL